jgi:hypothetical protein
MLQKTPPCAAGGLSSTGKTHFLYQLAQQLGERRDHAVILELDGHLLSRFAIHGDRVSKPLDARTEHGNPFLDIKERGDLESLVMTTIPAVSGDNQEWRGYGRTIMQAVLVRLQGTRQAPPRHVVYPATRAQPLSGPPLRRHGGPTLL